MPASTRTWASSACALGLGLLLQGCGGGDPAAVAPTGASVHALGAPSAAASAIDRAAALRRKNDPLCVTSWGVDVNAVLGTDIEIITGETGCDTEIAAHRHWAQLLVFWFNDPGGSEAVPLLYPPGYVPLDRDPMQDFLKRVESFTYVLQPSGRTFTYTTHHLKQHLYPASLVAVFGGSGQFPEAWNKLRTLTVLPPLPPLQPGAYTTSVSVTFSQAFCDGTSDDPAACLPAGTTPFYAREFTAVARAH